MAALRRALEEQDLVTHDTERSPLDHRFVAVDPATGAECTVEVFADGGRLHDRVTLDIGPVLHPEDLAADKMLALWGRARPRDFFDVAALILDALRAIARLSNAGWAEDGISNDDAQQLRMSFDAWRNQLKLDTT